LGQFFLRQFACLALVIAVAMGARAGEVAVLQNGFEIPHERREQSGTTTRLYMAATADSGYVDVSTDQIVDYRHEDTTAHPAEPALAKAEVAPAKMSPEQIDKLISAASSRHSIDPDLISSVIHAESNFNPKARSPKGAQGLMQLMPGTASRLGVIDAYEADANIDAGTRYLRQLLLRYDDDMVKALAAYNAGPERVEQYRGIPPYAETHAYVARVITDFNRKKQAQSKTAKTSSTTGSRVSAKKTVRKPVAAAHSSAGTTASGAQSASTIALATDK